MLGASTSLLFVSLKLDNVAALSTMPWLVAVLPFVITSALFLAASCSKVMRVFGQARAVIGYHLSARHRMHRLFAIGNERERESQTKQKEGERDLEGERARSCESSNLLCKA